MSQRDPDAAAGIYVVLISGTIIVCLLGAFVLPASISFNKWLGIFGLVGFFIGYPVLNRLAHRSRIREAVQEMGGTVIKIQRLPFWRQDSFFGRSFVKPVKHKVDYKDTLELLHHALCKSSWFYGVEWLDDVIDDTPLTA